MRNKLKLYITISILFLIIALAAWLSVFYKHPFSHKTENWSDFGSYIGGIFSPVLSFISILYVLHTLEVNNKNHNSQMGMLQREQSTNEFKFLLEELENKINDKEYYSTDVNKIRESEKFENISIKIASEFTTERKFYNTLDSKDLIDLKKRCKELTIELIEHDYIISYDLESELLLVLLERIQTSDNSMKKIFKAIFSSRFNNDQKYFMECYLAANYPDAHDNLSRDWPDFSKVPNVLVGRAQLSNSIGRRPHPRGN